MAEIIYIKENYPFPNNPLPVLYYPSEVESLIEMPNPEQNVLALFGINGYSNGWVNGVFPFHHFHANTHEVLACTSGEAAVQLGGSDASIYMFSKGDVLLLPAGTAHKNIQASEDFKIVGAYPGGLEPDMQKGEAMDYENIKRMIASVAQPDKDPIEGKNGAVQEYWQ